LKRINLLQELDSLLGNILLSLFFQLVFHIDVLNLRLQKLHLKLLALHFHFELSKLRVIAFDFFLNSIEFLNKLLDILRRLLHAIHRFLKIIFLALILFDNLTDFPGGQLCLQVLLDSADFGVKHIHFPFIIFLFNFVIINSRLNLVTDFLIIIEFLLSFCFSCIQVSGQTLHLILKALGYFSSLIVLLFEHDFVL